MYAITMLYKTVTTDRNVVLIMLKGQ